MSKPPFSNTCSIGLLSIRTSAVKPRKPLPLGKIGQVGEHFRPDAAVMMIVADGKGHLRRMGFLIDAVLSHADDQFVFCRSDDGQDDHLPGVIDDDKVLQTFVRHVLAFGKKTTVQAPVGQGIEEILHQGFIADLDGTQEDLQAGFRGPVGFEVFRIFTPLSRG